MTDAYATRRLMCLTIEELNIDTCRFPIGEAAS
jgi:hypothetical protein